MPGAGPSSSPAPHPGRRGPDRGLSRNQRVTRTAEFREAYAQGRRWVGRTMVLWLRHGEGASLRLGVVASRKVGRAVQRGRARRLLREAYRQNRFRFEGPFDIILVARRRILEAAWQEIEGELLNLAEKAGLLAHTTSNGRARGEKQE